MAVNPLETLQEQGDNITGRVVSTQPSPEAPSEYGIVTLETDNGDIEIDLDLNDNLRREMDGILDSYFAEHPEGQPKVRIFWVDPEEVARPDKDFTPRFAHAVVLVDEDEEDI